MPFQKSDQPLALILFVTVGCPVRDTDGQIVNVRVPDLSGLLLQRPGCIYILKMSRSEIPVIDVSSLKSGNPEAIHQLDEALHNTGFLYIKNHGVDAALQKKLFELSQKFFAESQDFKMNIAMKKAGLAWRGYFPVGGELTSGKPDQKEGIYFGRESKPGHPLHGANQWPEGEKFSEFKTLVLGYMKELTELSQTLMTGIAFGLGLNEDYFAKRFTNEPTTLFRIFNYPKHKKDGDECGVREHTDMGFLTILLQDKSGGLQIKSKTGEWISAPPIDGTFVVNIGDMLEVWTKGIYGATAHRVRNEGKGSRLSLPFFFDPNWNATLESIDTKLLSKERLKKASKSPQKRWDGLELAKLGGKMTYGEFVWAKVKNVFPELANHNLTQN